MQRGGVGDLLGVPGKMGLSGASESSESESESGFGGAALEGEFEEGEVVGKTGLSGASERSESES